MSILIQPRPGMEAHDLQELYNQLLLDHSSNRRLKHPFFPLHGDAIDALPLLKKHVVVTDEGAPVNAEEETLVGIFCSVLGCRQVAVTDSFHARGLEPAQATRIIARIHASFGVVLNQAEVYAAGNIRALAALVTKPALHLQRAETLPTRVTPRVATRLLSQVAHLSATEVAELLARFE